MENTFFKWESFAENYGSQLVNAEDVYNRMSEGGLIKNSLLKFDFHYLSDDKTNLDRLAEFLQKSYPYSLKPIIKRDDGLWELSGETNEIPVTLDNLTFWVLDLYKRGYEYDSELDGYGAPYDPESQQTPDFSAEKEDYYFDLAMKRYSSGDLSGAIINWNNVLEVKPEEVNSLYSRAIVKNELYAWKSALRDYDKAIEIAPKFISAILNRGSLKDENGDYKGAIEDYDLVIASENSDNDDLQMAYFNKGNTYFNLDNKSEACGNWKKAAELGATFAEERMKKYCSEQ